MLRRKKDTQADICLQIQLGKSTMSGDTGGTSFFPLCVGSNTLPPVVLLTGVLLQSSTCLSALSRATFSVESMQSTGLMLTTIIKIRIYFITKIKNI